jgi:anti-sigma regulatory factor (Ser/Thr protein kinase)
MPEPKSGYPSRIEHRCHFHADLASAGRARRHTASILRGHGIEEQIPALMLLVSELVTNAVMHANPPYALVVDIEADTVRISVEDGDAADPPQLRSLEQPRSGRGGHGLRIVDQLADDWGWEVAQRSATGKSVWFTIESRVHEV